MSQEELSSRWQRQATILEFPDPQVPEGVFLDTDQLPADPENKVHLAHGEIQIGDGKTYYRGFFPENRSEEGLGLFFSGYSGFLKSSEPLGMALAQAGLANIVVDPVRRYNGSIKEDLTNPQLLPVLTMEAVVRDLPHNRRVTHKTPDGMRAIHEQKVLAAHSMGGLSAPEYALKHVNDVESLFLLQAVVRGAAIRRRIAEAVIKGEMLGAVRHELIPYVFGRDIERTPKNVFRMLRYFGIGDPRATRITRPIGEGISCLTADMRPTLKKLGETSVKTVYIQAGKDVLVDPGDDIEDHVDKLVVLQQYGHLVEQVRPKIVAKALLDARHELAQAA